MQHMKNALIRGIKGILMVLMIMMVFTVCYGVFTRYVLNDAAVWTGELAGYVLVWITFLGAAWAVFEQSHIAFDDLVKKFPRPIYIIIQLIFNLTMLAFVIALVYYGSVVTGNAMQDETLTLPLVTKGVIYSVLPISGVIMAFAFILEIAKLFQIDSAKDSQMEMQKNEQVVNRG